jgi:hypothetical protein
VNLLYLQKLTGVSPDNSDSDQLFDNNNMETEEVQQDRHLAGTSNRTTNTS